MPSQADILSPASNSVPAVQANSTQTSNGLHKLLLGVHGLLWVMLIFMIAVALVMLIPSGLRESLLKEYAASEGAVLQTTAVAWVSLCGAIIVAAYICVVRLMGKIVKTLQAGDPFVPENISRLRKIWMIIAGAEIFRMATKLIVASSEALGSDEGVVLDIRVITWFLVFIIAALAEVFRHGTELRRDQEFTI